MVHTPSNMYQMASTLSDIAGLKGIYITHINIQSINHKVDEVIDILDLGNIDILCITESWLSRYVPDSLIYIQG